jgi:predicted ATP-binding protein involved in virulence
MRVSPEEQKLLQSCSLEVKLSPSIVILRQIGPLTLSQLSDGEKRLFSLFVDIARQLSVQNDQNEIGGGEAIILIDEIDVHLHPKWQRRIVPALEDLFPRCQFIATTHSPFVIQATDRHKITSIDPAIPITLYDGGNSIEDIAEDIQGISVPQRSLRAERLSEAAKRYFTLLKVRESNAELVAPAEIRAAEQDYREATEPFSSDPAVHALLKVQLMEKENK